LDVACLPPGCLDLNVSARSRLPKGPFLTVAPIAVGELAFDQFRWRLPRAERNFVFGCPPSMTTTLTFVTEAVDDDLASTKLNKTSDGIPFATNT
jgi:hypothetical protein